MSFPVEAFWKLIVEGQLLSLEDCHRYHAAWSAQNPQGDAKQLAEWLFAQNVISRYQASILLAGRAGPFVYGDYKIYDRIESGRLKGIFRALHMQTMHTVCLQFLTAEQAASPESVARLAQQAVHVSRTSAGYPHLLRCYQLVDLGAYKFFVLEDLQGKRVERLLHQKGAMQQSEACRIARQAALGLARLHASQQAHGDIRPTNLWVDASGTIKLLQFPLSRDPLSAPIDWRRVAAEPAVKPPPEADFVAPEQIAGGQADARSDIYQLGCCLYTMLTNRPPFPAKSLREKLEGHLKETPTPIEQLNPAVAPALSKVVMYMMSKKPDMRYQQAASVIEKLLPFMTPADAQSQPVPPPPQSQAYDAWLLAHLSGGAPQPMPMSAAAPQPMPAQAAQTAMMSQPGMQPGQPYASQQYAGQPYGAQPMPQGNPYTATAPAYAAAPMPSYSQPAPPPEPEPAPPPRPGAAPPRPGAAPPRSSFAAEPPRVRRNNSNLMFLVGIVGAALVLPVGYFIWDSYGKSTAPTPPPNPAIAKAMHRPSATGGTKPATGPKTVVGPKGTAAATAAAPEAPTNNVVVERDTMAALGEPIWDSPTAGKALALNYLPRGVSLIIALRPADIMQHEEAHRLYQENADPERKLRILGDAANWFENTLPAWSGTTLDNIEQVLIGLLDGGDVVRAGYVLRLKSPVEEATVAQAWGNPTPEEVEGNMVYVRDGLACYLPKSASGRAIVIAPREEMSDLLMLQGGPPQLARRELDVLARSSDSDRHLSILYSPQYLTSGGRAAVAGALSKAVDPLNWLFTGVGLTPSEGAAMPTGEDAEPPKAVLFSAHLAKNSAMEDLFWELRLYNAAASSIQETAVQPLANRVKEIPSRMESYVLGLGLSPYSRAVLFKFPRMVKFFADNVRAASADRQLVLRGYLPGVATHNLVLGTYLCLLESSGGYVASTGPTAPTGPAKVLTALEALRTKKMELAFDRNDLGKILQMVQDELGFPIEMVDRDFQLAGITKNQSMGLNEPMQTIDKLLQVILKKANLDGNLVLMIKPGADGKETVFIATRAGAADRKEKMLPEFEQAPVKK